MHQLARTKAEEEERIAAVLQQRMLDSERSAKELQQLRNESAELRELQVTCLASKVNWMPSNIKCTINSTPCCCCCCCCYALSLCFNDFVLHIQA